MTTMNINCITTREQYDEVRARVNELINEGERSKSAIEKISTKYNLKKNYVYDLYVKNK